MLDTLIRLSVRHRLAVVAAAALVLVLSLLGLRSQVIDIFPELNRPTVTIFTEAGALAPEEVESRINLPIERAVTGAPGVERVRSSAGIGLSLVHVEFAWSADPRAARLAVSERLLETRGSLPEGVTPTLTPASYLMGQILVLGLVSPEGKVDPGDLRDIADWELRPRLLAVPGVSKVTVVGGPRRQWQVVADPDRLRAAGVGLAELEAALEGAGLDAAGGFQSSGPSERLVRILARARGAEDLAGLVVRAEPGRTPLLVGDLAQVSLAPSPASRGDAGLDGAPAVLLAVQRQPGADTVALTRAIERATEEAGARLPAGAEIRSDLFRQSDFIERAIANVVESLRDGSLLVALVLVLFLLNLRTTAITLVAIPLSLLTTLGVFGLLGLGINTMTLGGLAVAIGELVDDAIVDVENVFRRLRENRQATVPRPATEVVVAASREVRGSIVIATSLVVLAFLPLLALEGVEGRLFAPLGLAYIAAILLSLLVSLTVTPALCALLLPGLRRLDQADPGPVVRFVQSLQGRVLEAAKSRPAWIAAGVLALLAAAGWGATRLGREFLPTLNEGAYTVFLNAAPGTSLAESSRIGRQAEVLLREIPEVRSVARLTGRAENDEHVLEANVSELEFAVASSERSRKEIESDIRMRLATIPGVAIGLGQPLSHRIDHVLSGVQAQIAVKVFGDDLPTLREAAARVGDVLRATPGMVDVQVEAVTEIPQVHVRVDPVRAAAAGLNPAEVARQAETALRGRVLGSLFRQGRAHDLVLALDGETRADLAAMAELPLSTPSGVVPLGALADLEVAAGPNLIQRENGLRRIVVSANAAGRDLVGAVDDARARLANGAPLPAGVHLAIDGQYASQAEARLRLAVLATLAVGGILLLLRAHFGSWRLAAQVLLNLPLALIGAVFGAWVAGGGVLSLATLVGCITLAGIASRNGILMVGHYLHLMRHEGERFDWQMVRRGSRERIVPVLMTAVTAALALLPLVLGGDQPGREILHPVAVVIFFGLLSSTLLDLVVTPLVFWHFGRPAIAKLVPQALQNPN
jgi:CzcA family heavy metal efflux pump